MYGNNIQTARLDKVGNIDPGEPAASLRRLRERAREPELAMSPNGTRDGSGGHGRIVTS